MLDKSGLTESEETTRTGKGELDEFQPSRCSFARRELIWAVLVQDNRVRFGSQSLPSEPNRAGVGDSVRGSSVRPDGHWSCSRAPVARSPCGAHPCCTLSAVLASLAQTAHSPIGQTARRKTR